MYYIGRYQKVSDGYTTFRLRTPGAGMEEGGAGVVELCEIDGWTYVALPRDLWDSQAWNLPAQPASVNLEGPLDVSKALGDLIIARSGFVRGQMEAMGAAFGLFAMGMTASAISAVVPGELRVDRWSIPSDGVTPAAVMYTTDETVHFSVDGEVHEVTPENRVATLEVTADAPGPVEIKIRDKQALIITATAT